MGCDFDWPEESRAEKQEKALSWAVQDIMKWQQWHCPQGKKWESECDCPAHIQFREYHKARLKQQGLGE